MRELFEWVESCLSRCVVGTFLDIIWVFENLSLDAFFEDLEALGVSNNTKVLIKS